MPHQAHLPALVGDTHADAALGELADCGLVSPVGSRYRLAAGVLTQLESAGYTDGMRERARSAAQHYAWWAGHPSVTPERVCAEADAVLAALAVLVPATTPTAEDEDSPAVQLARTAAPAFAAGLHWSAWQRALRSGTEASRLAGDVAEQAYFHHELGVLALCEDQLDRARAELEASIGLRGALSDKRGAVAGRRALALVADRTGDTPGLGSGGAGVAGAVAGFGVVGAGLGPTVGEEVPDARNEESVSPSAGVPAPFPPLQPPPQSPTLVTRREPDDEPSRTVAGGIKGFARRNLVAAGAGALLVAVLGTVVTLGATSENDAGDPSNEVGGTPSASQGIDDGSLNADRPSDDGKDRETPGAPTDSGPDGTPGTSDDPTPTESGEPSDGPSDSEQPGDPGSGDPSTPSDPTTSSKPPTSPSPTKSTPTDPPSSPSPSPDESETAPPESSPPETTPEPPSNSASDTNTPTAASSPVGTPTASQSSTGTATGMSSGSDDPEAGQII